MNPSRNAPKKRFVILDALRAIAGLTVPLFHLFEPLELRKDAPIASIVGHGYLAVEFFLLLMGYMLGHAYDRRWNDGMGLWGFFKRRLIRLHPLVVSGVVLGLAVALLQPKWGIWMPWLKSTDALGTAGLALWAATMVPVVGFGMISPFNACSWTLYYEYAGNILYALVIRHMSKTLLLVGALVGAFFWLTLDLHVNLNGLFGTHVALFDTVAQTSRWTIAGGWGATARHCYVGFVRLGFPLFFGLLLARLGWKIRLPKGALWIAAVSFAAILCTPCPDAMLHSWTNALFEALALMVAFPLLILVGVGSEADASTPLAKAFTFFAELSYPLYMSHYMFMYIYDWWVPTHSRAYSDAAVLLIVAAIDLALIAFATLIMLFYDRPVRKKLESWKVEELES